MAAKMAATLQICDIYVSYVLQIEMKYVDVCFLRRAN